jgi:hypothetical protein
MKRVSVNKRLSLNKRDSQKKRNSVKFIQRLSDSGGKSPTSVTATDTVLINQAKGLAETQLIHRSTNIEQNNNSSTKPEKQALHRIDETDVPELQPATVIMDRNQVKHERTDTILMGKQDLPRTVILDKAN